MRENSLIKKVCKLLGDGQVYTMPEMTEALEADNTQIHASILQLRKKGYDIKCEQVYRMYGEAAEEETISGKIYKYLMQHGSITNEEAQEKLYINNLGTYISSLQRQGYTIQKEWEYGKAKDGKRIVAVRYKLEGAEEAEPEFEEKAAENPVIETRAEARPDRWETLKEQIEASQRLVWSTLIRDGCNYTAGKEMYNALAWVIETMEKIEGDKTAYEMGHSEEHDG